MSHDGSTRDAGAVDVLIIDDEKSICDGCSQTLEAEGLRASTASDGRAGLELVETTHPKVVVVDLKMPGMSGLDVLAEVSRIDPSIVTIVITGFGSVDTAVESMKTGAFDFLTKPFGPDRLLESVRRGLQRGEEIERAEPVRPPADAVAIDRETAALQGMEALERYYSIGLGKRDLLEELSVLESEARVHAETIGRTGDREKSLAEVVRHLEIVDGTIARYNFGKSSLLQIMIDVQDRIHWLPGHVLRWISRRLKVPAARVHAIANFYDALHLEPTGAYTVEVCTGTACHVRGASRLNAAVSAMLGIEPGRTDPDMVFTLKNVHCLGCCALAPVMKIGERYYGNPSRDDLEKIFDSLRRENEKHVTN